MPTRSFTALTTVSSKTRVSTAVGKTHIGVAFDPHGGTFRHERYPLYKAQRDETPEAIRFGVPVIKDILAAYRIPVLEVRCREPPLPSCPYRVLSSKV